MLVFWEKGYECTSMQDLVGAMGINRGSLYATFGGKHALHLEALEYFFKTQIKPCWHRSPVPAQNAPRSAKYSKMRPAAPV